MKLTFIVYEMNPNLDTTLLRLFQKALNWVKAVAQIRSEVNTFNFLIWLWINLGVITHACFTTDFNYLWSNHMLRLLVLKVTLSYVNLIMVNRILHIMSGNNIFNAKKLSSTIRVQYIFDQEFKWVTVESSHFNMIRFVFFMIFASLL